MFSCHNRYCHYGSSIALAPTTRHDDHTNAKSKLETGQASFVELFTPKLLTVFREGYGATELRADAVAGSNADKF
jgi:hypothetical protein